MLLVTAVVGSGIMADRLSESAAVALLCNTIATGAALVVLVSIFAPISGAHLNPAVTMVAVLRRAMPPFMASAYVAAQVVGACIGVILAHLMRTVAQRSGGDVCPATHRLAGRSAPAACATGARRACHRCRLLVHGVDKLCEPCRHARPQSDANICRYRPRRRARFRVSADCWSASGPWGGDVAGSSSPGFGRLIVCKSAGRTTNAIPGDNPRVPPCGPEMNVATIADARRLRH
jgi:hypothetical protein